MTNLREAAQMALNALEKLNQDGWILADFEDEVYASIEALRAVLAQPEQEPVAWMYDWYDETEDIDGVPVGGIINDWISKDYDEAHSPTMGCHNIRPLYTAPPQHEWQGLIKGVRVDGCNVVVFAGNNDAARDLCGVLLKEKNT